MLQQVKRYCPNSSLNQEISSLQEGLEKEFTPRILPQKCKVQLLRLIYKMVTFYQRTVFCVAATSPSLQVTPQAPSAEVRLKIQVSPCKRTSAKIPISLVKLERTFSKEAEDKSG